MQTDTIDREAQCIFARAKKSSDRLLTSLAAHHDYSVPKMPTPKQKLEPKPETPSAAKVWIEKQKNVSPDLKAIWLSFLEDRNIESQPRVAGIQRMVAKYFGISCVDLLAERRTAKVVLPRQIAMYLARTFTTRSLPEIGRRFGGKDHTTVLHAVRKIEELCLSNWLVAYDVAHMESALEGAIR